MLNIILAFMFPFIYDTYMNGTVRYVILPGLCIGIIQKAQARIFPLLGRRHTKGREANIGVLL